MSKSFSKKFILTFKLFFIFTSLILNLFAEIDKVSEKFLKNLKYFSKKFGANPYPSSYVKKSIKKAANYYSIRNLDEKRIKYSKILLKAADKNLSIISDKKINSLLKRDTPLCANSLLKYFENKITNEKLTLKTGDIVMILPMTFKAYQYAYITESSYEHLDLIYIREDFETFVLELSLHDNFQVVPLIEYILGHNAPNSRFLILRHKDILEQNKLNSFFSALIKNNNNIIYDDIFERQTSIKDINIFFNKPVFFYCGELVYSLYEYVTNNYEFDSGIKIPLRKIIANRGLINQKRTMEILEYFEKFEAKENQFIILPETFLNSEKFETIAKMGETKPLKDIIDSK